MWDEHKQTRLQQLNEADTRGGLTQAERAELGSLIDERRQCEEAALQEATARTDRENARLAEQVQRAEAQNRELEELIQEQKRYLVEVEALIRQMEARRREWRERYTEVTGRPFGEASPWGGPLG
jgi:hypothetical protein